MTGSGISSVFPDTPIRAAFKAMEHKGHDCPVLLSTGELCLTYAALQENVEARALSFFSQGVRPGDVVALVNDDPFEFILHLLALAFLNVRVLLLDPATTSTSQQQLLRLSIARFLYSTAGGLSVFAQHKHSALSQQAQAEYHYLLLPTSASTGQPKIVVRTQDAMLAEGRAYTRSLPINTSDRMLVMLPLHHAFGVGVCVFGFLSAGCSLIVLDHFSPRAVLYAADEMQATLLPGVPYMFDLLARTLLKRAVTLDHLKICLAGAGPLSLEAFTQFRERFGQAIHSTFGSTETGAATWVSGNDFIERRVGQALWDVRMEIRSDEHNAQTEGAGQLFLQTPALMSGYLTERGLDTTQINAGWFTTGDLARREDNGDIYLLGRTAHIINIAGKKVNPRDVEVVVASYPEVEDVAVIGVTDEEHITRLAALVVASQPLDVQLLITYCAERLVSYQVPRFIKFTPSLQRNEAGKIVRESLYSIWNQQDLSSI